MKSYRINSVVRKVIYTTIVPTNPTRQLGVKAKVILAAQTQNSKLKTQNSKLITLLGLLGYPLGHSFSQRYFTEKFEREGISGYRYELFPLPDITLFPELIAVHPDLRGLNVTVPHKVTVMRYLDEIDDTARAVGAVNVIRIRQGRLTGFNTDVIGFEQSMLPWLKRWKRAYDPPQALILGTGGASKAVGYVLKKWGVAFLFVSRQPHGKYQIAYSNLSFYDFESLQGIFNTTPLGMYPETAGCPELPFDKLGPQHLVYDLVYNPPETLLLQRAKTRGATVKNGLEMLHLQAEAAWTIWRQH